MDPKSFPYYGRSDDVATYVAEKVDQATAVGEHSARLAYEAYEMEVEVKRLKMLASVTKTLAILMKFDPSITLDTSIRDILAIPGR